MQEAADDPGLRASLADLAGLITEGKTLPETLTRISTFAVTAVPGADGAGVAVLRPGTGTGRPARVEAVAATHPFVSEIDAVHGAVLEGPGISAGREGHTVCSGSLPDDERWPHFGRHAERLGVHSVLALPLIVSERPVGAITVWARHANAFADRAVALGELFASPAAVAVHNAQVLNRAFELTQELQSAVTSRPTVDQAIGLVRSRSGVSAEAAMQHLRELSHAEGRTLVDSARDLVDRAVRDAHRNRER